MKGKHKAEIRTWNTEGQIKIAIRFTGISDNKQYKIIQQKSDSKKNKQNKHNLAIHLNYVSPKIKK